MFSKGQVKRNAPSGPAGGPGVANGVGTADGVAVGGVNGFAVGVSDGGEMTKAIGWAVWSPVLLELAGVAAFVRASVVRGVAAEGSFVIPPSLPS